RPDSLDEQEDVIDQIENFTRTEYRLRNYAESYNVSSIKAKELEGGTVVISFDYSKYGLPQDISYFRFLSVELSLENGGPQRMRIFNRKPFSYDKYSVDSYEQRIEFSSLASGKLIIASKNTEIK
ncbi:hypothetical protein AB4189_27190, partial [Vibrio sp. 10N.286.49.E1]